jgi:hypothetical protein
MALRVDATEENEAPLVGRVARVMEKLIVLIRKGQASGNQPEST